MAELTVRERLQPSLLDRLTDDEPKKKVESREQRVISLERLRAGVLRDLSWLLNTGNLAQTDDLEAYPEVACSVVNFGTRDLSGITASSLLMDSLARMMRQVILDFEPRILRDTLSVRAIVEEQRMNVNAVTFVIEGTLWAQPIPLRMFMKTEVDLETGYVNVREETGR
jgi:type VI secretion system protein ImpF